MKIHINALNERIASNQEKLLLIWEKRLRKKEKIAFVVPQFSPFLLEFSLYLEPFSLE